MTRCFRFDTTAISILLLAITTLAANAQTTTPEWRRHSPLPLPLAGHAVALLPNGDIVIAGGLSADGAATRSSFIYSAATGRIVPTTNQLNIARAYHTLVAVEIASVVRVFAIGGYGGTNGSYRGESSVEVLEHDAAAGTWRWRPVGSLSVARGDLRAAYDRNGGIVVSGGRTGTGGSLRSGPLSAAADRIDVTTLDVTPLGPMTAARAEHVTATFRAEDRSMKVLVAGGEAGATATQILAGAIWDPIANPPVAFRTAGVGVGDPQGIARAFGGRDASGAPLAACEWYDVKRGWRAAPRMNEARASFDAALIAGPIDSADAYLAVAGEAATAPLASTEIFELPGSSLPNGAWTGFARLNDAASERRLAISGANLPVVFGGATSGDRAIDGTEIFQPLRANDVAFGLEEIGRRSDSQLVVVENTWMLPVRVREFRIDGSAEFLVRGDTNEFVLSPGERHSVRVYFQPAAAGERTGRLLFDVGPLTDTVRLSGRAVASELTVLNSPLDFGGQLVATRRTECIALLRNDGAQPATVDSIVLAPPGAYRLVSPLGRVTIGPGDSLLVCVEFAPSAQGITTADASIHIASRRFGVPVLGRGLRRYAVASTITDECDTVMFSPGVETTGTIRLENRGDTTITIDAPAIAASSNGLFRVADPGRFPITLAPRDASTVDVIFAPQRESREVATLSFPNDGDTAITATLCFIARSRYLSVSQPSVDLGTLCIGDSADALVTIENPSGVESVELRDVTADASTGVTVGGFVPRTLGPREYVTVAIGYRASIAGLLATELTVTSDRGDVVIPITAQVLRSGGFRARSSVLTIGDTTVLPIDIVGVDASTSVRTANIVVEYDATAIVPIAVVALPGAPVIDATSRVRILGGGRASIDIAWSGAGIAADGPAFGLVAETLRGDVDSTAIILSGEPRNGYCTRAIETVIDVRGPCADDVGGIRTAKARFVTASPNPASASILVTVVANDGELVDLDVVDANGRPVVASTLVMADGRSNTARIDLSELPAGMYLLRARGETTTVGTVPVLVTR
jgi:hypothetical protein